MVIPIILLRSVKGTVAHLAVIDALTGGESLENWEEAFAHIPPTMYRRIVALVSDDHPSLMWLARKQGWLHQVCTFHVKSRFQNWLPKRRHTKHERELRKVWKAVQVICDDPNTRRVGAALRVLHRYSWHAPFPYQLQLKVRGLRRSWRTCRTYFMHPELRLPDTSNAVESVASRVREMLAKRKGLRTVRSLKQWLILFQRVHPTVRCNGAKNLQN